MGYEIDENGYFTEEFNKVAGIPEDYKIHSSTMESLANVATDKSDWLRIFRELDIAKTAGNAYKILSQVVGEEVLNSKDSFTLDEIAKFPQGYKFNQQTMQVSKVYDTIVDFASDAMSWSTPIGGRPDRMGLSSLFYNNSLTKPSTDIFNNANGGVAGNYLFDMTSDKYTNADGSITKGGLLIAVINANLHTREGETTANGKAQGYDKSMSYEQIINYDASKDPNSVKGEWYITGGLRLRTAQDVGAKNPVVYKAGEINPNAQKEFEEYLKNYKDPLTALFENMNEQQKLNLEELIEKQRELKEKMQKAILEKTKKVDIEA